MCLWVHAQSPLRFLGLCERCTLLGVLASREGTILTEVLLPFYWKKGGPSQGGLLALARVAEAQASCPHPPLGGPGPRVYRRNSVSIRVFNYPCRGPPSGGGGSTAPVDHPQTRLEWT